MPAIKLNSASFSNGEIPKQFTCDGADRSPALSWSRVPSATRSLALVVIDEDAPFGAFVHWILYDLPPGKKSLSEGLPHQPQLLDGSRQGLNGFDGVGYGGPCPPGSSPHRYVFTLYALSIVPTLPPGASEKQLVQAIRTDVLAQGTLVERYHR